MMLSEYQAGTTRYSVLHYCPKEHTLTFQHKEGQYWVCEWCGERTPEDYAYSKDASLASLPYRKST